NFVKSYTVLIERVITIKKDYRFLTLVIILILSFSWIFQMGALTIIFESTQTSLDQSHDSLKVPNQFQKVATNGEEYSQYNLSIIFY
ncbi:MAG: hypothetical protein ACFFG0_41305, partial [Candidatus Thorarchaeota archaeon]